MDIPVSLFGTVTDEGSMFFFKSGCPIGIEEHMHVCIKKGESIFLFATCSSQIQKAKDRAKKMGLDLKSYPVFKSNDTNKFDKEETYIDCNSPIEISFEDFNELVKDQKIYELPGKFDAESLALIAEGVKCSKLVTNRIKKMF